MSDTPGADYPQQSEYLGVYEGGVVRLSANVDWPDGTRVSVRVADIATPEPGKKLGKVIVAGFGLAGRCGRQDLSDQRRRGRGGGQAGAGVRNHGEEFDG